MSAPPSKLRRPETRSQAASWQRMNSQALAHGFCHACSAQHAYGRQHGFRQVRPPCLTCRPLAEKHAPAWGAAGVPLGARTAKA